MPKTCCVLNNSDPNNAEPKDEAKCYHDVYKNVTSDVYLHYKVIASLCRVITFCFQVKFLKGNYLFCAIQMQVWIDSLIDHENMTFYFRKMARVYTYIEKRKKFMASQI